MRTRRVVARLLGFAGVASGLAGVASGVVGMEIGFPLGLLSVALGVSAWVVPLRRPAAAPETLDAAAARRESHRLGLPFPEADGTLSLPPETTAERDQRIHDDLHARRCAAELAGPDGAWHWPGCRCVATVMTDGRVVVSQPDFRCSPLRLS